ncbi:MAG TPA: M14 family metallopeptidase [Gammaproteobacteria bacterium]|nr:M14 family metallopeptidase [Gammaproteobacteria bacterium]
MRRTRKRFRGNVLMMPQSRPLLEASMGSVVQIVLVFLAITGAAHARDLSQLGPLRASAGQAVSGHLEVPALSDVGARIPVSLVRGANDGPVLALIAGTHGYEYPGISALQRLRQSIDPRALRGTLILVHIANPPSFYGRTIYTSPADGKNLNRVFPGRPDGTLSERIAHEITTHVIANADFLVDLHAGDGNEALRPYVYMPVTGDARLDAASRGMALAFGLDHIVIDAARIVSPEATKYVDQTALARGVPAITTETGQLGQNDEHSIALAERGIQNLMRHLGMLEGTAEPNSGVVWLEDYQVITSPVTGVFRATVRDGYAVAEGGLLGELYDAFGARIGDVRAPFAGIVNYVIGTPPAVEGQPLAMVSRIAAAPQ